MVLITGNPETNFVIKTYIWAWVSRRTLMSWSRRDFAVMLPLVASLRLSVDEQSQLPSECSFFQYLPVRHSDDKLDFRPIVPRETVDGCRVAVHESALAPKANRIGHTTTTERRFSLGWKERWRLPSTENPRASLGYQLHSSDRETSTESATRRRLWQDTTSLSWVRRADQEETPWTD